MTITEAREELNSSSSSSEKSLPQQRDENMQDVGQQQEIPEAVGSRVEQLTKMVENLSAKFVLLENHLKLAQVQAEGHETVDGGETGNTVEREKEKEESERKLPLGDITRELLLKQPHSNTPTKQAKKVNKSMSEAALSQREADHLSSVSTPEPSSSERMPLPLVREDYVHRYTSHTTHHSLKLDFASPSTPVGFMILHSKIFCIGKVCSIRGNYP